MMRRVKTQYSGSRAGFLWAIVEPMIWVVFLKFAFSSGGLPPLGTSYAVFFATGVIIARTWRSLSQKIATTATGRKRLNLPAFQRMDAAYATFILELAVGGVAMSLILTGIRLSGVEDAAPADLLTCLAAWTAMAFIALGFGLTLAAVITLFPVLQHFQRFFMVTLFWMSGFSFLVDRMPPTFRAVVLWNPVVHIMEWFREGFYRGYYCASLDRGYVVSSTVVLLFIGMAAERALRNYAVGMGSRR